MGILEDDYYCIECGAPMEAADDTVLVCTSCGHSVDIDDYNDEEEDYYDGTDAEEDIPEGCAACGGPYPECMISCKVFDD
ncbi:MAG: hypothetical protein HFH39_04060 [Lachnospiraceae bacterium]|nr:hypothetical protein [Lachnospiraceae bacterium]